MSFEIKQATRIHAPARGAFHCRVVRQLHMAEHVVGVAGAVRARVANCARAVHALARDRHLVTKEDGRGLASAGVRDLQPERRAVLHGDRRAAANGIGHGEGQRTSLHQHLALERRGLGGQHHLARAALHEPRVVADRRAVRKRLAGVGRHYEIRAVDHRAPGKRHNGGQNRETKYELLHELTFRRCWRTKDEGQKTKDCGSILCLPSSVLCPFPQPSTFLYFSSSSVPMTGPKL